MNYSTPYFRSSSDPSNSYSGRQSDKRGNEKGRQFPIDIPIQINRTAPSSRPATPYNRSSLITPPWEREHLKSKILALENLLKSLESEFGSADRLNIQSTQQELQSLRNQLNQLDSSKKWNSRTPSSESNSSKDKSNQLHSHRYRDIPISIESSVRRDPPRFKRIVTTVTWEQTRTIITHVGARVFETFERRTLERRTVEYQKVQEPDFQNPQTAGQKQNTSQDKEANLSSPKLAFRDVAIQTSLPNGEKNSESQQTDSTPLSESRLQSTSQENPQSNPWHHANILSIESPLFEMADSLEESHMAEKTPSLVMQPSFEELVQQQSQEDLSGNQSSRSSSDLSDSQLNFSRTSSNEEEGLDSKKPLEKYLALHASTSREESPKSIEWEYAKSSTSNTSQKDPDFKENNSPLFGENNSPLFESAPSLTESQTLQNHLALPDEDSPPSPEFVKTAHNFTLYFPSSSEEKSDAHSLHEADFSTQPFSLDNYLTESPSNQKLKSVQDEQQQQTQKNDLLEILRSNSEETSTSQEDSQSSLPLRRDADGNRDLLQYLINWEDPRSERSNLETGGPQLQNSATESDLFSISPLTSRQGSLRSFFSRDSLEPAPEENRGPIIAEDDNNSTISSFSSVASLDLLADADEQQRITKLQSKIKAKIDEIRAYDARHPNQIGSLVVPFLVSSFRDLTQGGEAYQKWEREKNEIEAKIDNIKASDARYSDELRHTLSSLNDRLAHLDRLMNKPVTSQEWKNLLTDARYIFKIQRMENRIFHYIRRISDFGQTRGIASINERARALKEIYSENSQRIYGEISRIHGEINKKMPYIALYENLLQQAQALETRYQFFKEYYRPEETEVSSYLTTSQLSQPPTETIDLGDNNGIKDTHAMLLLFKDAFRKVRKDIQDLIDEEKRLSINREGLHIQGLMDSKNSKAVLNLGNQFLLKYEGQFNNYRAWRDEYLFPKIMNKYSTQVKDEFEKHRTELLKIQQGIMDVRGILKTYDEILRNLNGILHYLGGSNGGEKEAQSLVKKYLEQVQKQIRDYISNSENTDERYTELRKALEEIRDELAEENLSIKSDHDQKLFFEEKGRKDIKRALRRR